MSEFSRRSAFMVGAGLLSTTMWSTSNPVAFADADDDPITIRPGVDPQYDSYRVGYNRRFNPHPQQILVPSTPQQAVTAVQRAVDLGHRFTVISGGHCFENFALPDDIDTLINVGSLNTIEKNSERNTYQIGSGARLLDVYETLFREHGVTIPGGVCYSVGAGGHITGGGYGLLSRLYGLTVDHLVGVEVVTVNENRKAELVYCSPTDRGDTSDLFWAHTGGGGGSFGLITRFDFQTPGESRGLISPPSQVTLIMCNWPWEGTGFSQFTRFMNTFTDWCSSQVHSDRKHKAVFPWLVVRHQKFGGLGIAIQVADESSEYIADKLVSDLASALGRNDSGAYVQKSRMPWMNSVRTIGTGSAENHDPNRRGKQGSANLNTGFTKVQLEHLFSILTSDIQGSVSAGIDIAALGGAISERGPQDTAVYQRNAAMKFLVQTFWEDPQWDDKNISWLRHAYHGLFRDGAPTFNAQTAGSYINYPNSDLSDPTLNQSGFTAQELYFGENLPRLTRIKKRWDPWNFFHNSQSVTL